MVIIPNKGKSKIARRVLKKLLSAYLCLNSPVEKKIYDQSYRIKAYKRKKALEKYDIKFDEHNPEFMLGDLFKEISTRLGGYIKGKMPLASNVNDIKITE
jgi:DnaJ-class molecular chaperone